MPFAPSPAPSAIRFDEPVRSLRPKHSPVWSISPDATVYQAIEMMSERKVGALVVLTGSHLAGIVSERDYARKVIQHLTNYISGSYPA